jgi:hypothetical protein
MPPHREPLPPEFGPQAITEITTVLHAVRGEGFVTICLSPAGGIAGGVIEVAAEISFRIEECREFARDLIECADVLEALLAERGSIDRTAGAFPGLARSGQAS